MTDEEIEKSITSIKELLTKLPIENDPHNTKYYSALETIRTAMKDKSAREKMVAKIMELLPEIDNIKPKFSDKDKENVAYVRNVTGDIKQKLAIHLKNLAEILRDYKPEGEEKESDNNLSPEVKSLYLAAGDLLLEEMRQWHSAYGGSDDLGTYYRDSYYLVNDHVGPILRNHKLANGDPSIRENTLKEAERLIGEQIKKGALESAGLGIKDAKIYKKEDTNNWKLVQKIRKEVI